MRRHTRPAPGCRTSAWSRLWLVTWLALGGLFLTGAFRGSLRPESPAPTKSTAAPVASTPATAAAPRDRTRSIEDILPGDVVLAWDEQSGEIVPKRVVGIFRNTTHHLRLVTIRSADGLSHQTLQTTDEHPFYVVGVGWVEAAQLAPADRLLQADGQPAEVLATAREPHPDGLQVYNFEVEDCHTYFVAADLLRMPVLAHNRCRSTSSSHGNSLLSKRPQHRYEIIDRFTGIPYKTGVSGGRIRKDGLSARAEQQVRALLRAGRDVYSVIVEVADNRAAILKAEKAAVTWSRRLNETAMEGNRLPKPTL